MAFESLRAGWDWFVGGLAEALLRAQDRWTRQPASRIDVEDAGARITAPDGLTTGRFIVAGANVRIDPPEIAPRLAGTAIDVHVPTTFLFRRDLDPIAAQSAPYVDAFVRHQIDKITPWRVADVHYHTLHAPLPSDPTRLSVAVGVVPRRLVQWVVDECLALRPKRILLIAPHASSPTGFTMVIDDRSLDRMLPLSRKIGIALAAMGIGLVAAIGWTWWQADSVRTEIADQDQVIEQRNTILAAAKRRAQAGAEIEARLRTLSESRAKVVDTLDALSAALPDSAYLTALTIDKEQIQISGITRDLAQLVPALEAPGRFMNAAFTEATTKVESANGDRFHLQMRASGPGRGPAPP